jgi:hypothetical protein
MCNAYNHPPDCTCGFGPPYTVEGRIRLGKRQPWYEIAISNEKALEKGLIEIGFDSQEIVKTLDDYKDASKKKVDLKSWLKHILGRYTYCEVGKPKVLFLKIPIFKLHLPEQERGNKLHKVRRSKITFNEKITIVQKCTLSFKIFGIGMGDTHTLEIECSVEEVAEKGKCKIIYIKIPIRITKVTVIEGNNPIKDILRAEVDSSASIITFRNGSQTCKEKECTEDLKLADYPIDFFPLAGCNRGSVHHYGRTQACGNTNQFEIGINAFGFKAFMTVLIQRDRQQSLEYDLPGGYNYLSFSLKGVDGITWKLFNNDEEVAEYLQNLKLDERPKVQKIVEKSMGKASVTDI